MALFGRRRQAQDFAEHSQQYVWEMAQITLRELLWEHTNLAVSVAEGDIIGYSDSADGPLVPGYMMLMPAELLWAYANDGDVQRLDISDGSNVSDRPEFGPPGAVTVMVTARPHGGGIFSFPEGSELPEALRRHSDSLDD